MHNENHDSESMEKIQNINEMINSPSQDIWFKPVNSQYVRIMRGTVEVGRIFTPAGSSNNEINCIQVCGFSEAFSLWACAWNERDSSGKIVKEHKDFKDIQLLFDDTKLEGSFSVSNCSRCFHYPCQCEHREKGANPFVVKREEDLKSRILYLNKITGNIIRRTDAVLYMQGRDLTSEQREKFNIGENEFVEIKVHHE
ncbi:MAG: hypothetical protein ACYCS1_05210 [Gammaproteobacteria bacterium]